MLFIAVSTIQKGATPMPALSKKIFCVVLALCALPLVCTAGASDISKQDPSFRNIQDANSTTDSPMSSDIALNTNITKGGLLGFKERDTLLIVSGSTTPPTLLWQQPSQAPRERRPAFPSPPAVTKALLTTTRKSADTLYCSVRPPTYWAERYGYGFPRHLFSKIYPKTCFPQSKGVDSHVAQTEPLERGYNNYLSNWFPMRNFPIGQP